MLRPEVFKVQVASDHVRYGFALVRPNRTRRLYLTLDVFDRRWDGFRSRGFDLDARLFD